MLKIEEKARDAFVSKDNQGNAVSMNEKRLTEIDIRGLKMD
jgi:hypothetical protein